MKKDLDERTRNLIRKANHAAYQRDRLLISAQLKFLKCKDKYTTNVFEVLNERELTMLEIVGVRIIQHTEFANEPKQVWMALEEVKKVRMSL